MLLLLSHHYHPLSVSMWCIGCWCCCCCHILHRSLCAMIIVACIVWVLVVLLLLSHPSSVSVCCGRCGPYWLVVGGVAVVVTSFISLCVPLSLWPVLSGCWWCCCCCHILHQSLCAVVIVACIVWVLVVLLLLSHPSSVSLLWFMAIMLGCWWCCCCSQKKGCVLFSGLGDGIIHVKTLSIFEEVSFDDCRVSLLSIRVTPSKTSR